MKWHLYASHSYGITLIIYCLSTTIGSLIVAPLRALRPPRQLDEAGNQFKKAERKLARQYTLCDFFTLTICLCINLALFRALGNWFSTPLDFVAVINCLLITCWWFKLVRLMQPIKTMSFIGRLYFEVVTLIVAFIGPPCFIFAVLLSFDLTSKVPLFVSIILFFLFVALHGVCESIVEVEKVARDRADELHFQAASSLNSSSSSSSSSHNSSSSSSSSVSSFSSNSSSSYSPCS